MATASAPRIPSPLKPFGRKVYSQTNEDGIIEAIFSAIAPTSHFFVEFGIGPHYRDKSYERGLAGNTVLLREQGWRGIMMDGRNHPPRFNVLKEFITATNVNGLFRKYCVSEDVDLVSIDVDGQDFWIWMALQWRAKLVVIEYNANHRGMDNCITVAFDHAFRWDGTRYYGASIGALNKLGRDKGYTLVHANGVNCFFVRDDLFSNAHEFKGEQFAVWHDQHRRDWRMRRYVRV